jgi:REP element-mobilizing transposase RayT
MEKKSKSHPAGWHGRGYLPHFDGGPRPQFITFRLADSLPADIFEKLKRRLESGRITEWEYAFSLDRYLDRSRGGCALRMRPVAEVIRDAVLHFDGKRYKLHSWVIMPNHVHLLLTQFEGESLGAIMHSLKSFTAKKANKILGRSGNFWSKEYFDRYIRDGEHFTVTKRYIEKNPVKAGLCETPEVWEFGSAFESRE